MSCDSFVIDLRLDVRNDVMACNRSFKMLNILLPIFSFLGQSPFDFHAIFIILLKISQAIIGIMVIYMMVISIG